MIRLRHAERLRNGDRQVHVVSEPALMNHLEPTRGYGDQ